MKVSMKQSLSNVLPYVTAWIQNKLIWGIHLCLHVDILSWWSQCSISICINMWFQTARFPPCSVVKEMIRISFFPLDLSQEQSFSWPMHYFQGCHWLLCSHHFWQSQEFWWVKRRRSGVVVQGGKSKLWGGWDWSTDHRTLMRETSALFLFWNN